MTTLYRKYRPKNFTEVVGQNHIKTTLRHEVETEKITHAYLFCGPRAVGKTTISRVLAKSVNCQEIKPGQSNPCNKCDICNDINSGKSLDIIEIDAASNTGVDNVRENIISVSKTSTSRSKYKVFIIDEVHMLSTQAFNALLKTLEEPPKNVIFILCTTEIHKVPATIISRCQRFDFKRINISDIVKKLQYIAEKEKVTVSKTILEAIARNSEGHMRDAESLFGQVISVGSKNITPEEADLVIPRSDLNEAISLIEFLSENNAASAIALINRIVDEGIDVKRFLIDTIEIARKIMFSKLNNNLSERFGLEMGEEMELKISKISNNIELNKIITITNKLLKAKNNTNKSFIAQLPTEIAITELCLTSQNTYNSPPATPTNHQTFTTRPTSISTPQQKEKPRTPTPSSNTESTLEVEQEIKKEITQKTPPQKENTAQQKSNSNNLNFNTIKEKWPDVVAGCIKANALLSCVARTSEPKDFNNNTLTIAVKYKFHQDNLSNIDIKTALENVLREVFLCNLAFDSICDEDLTPGEISTSSTQNKETENNQEKSSSTSTNSQTEEKKPIENNEMMNDLMNTFGAKEVG